MKNFVKKSLGYLLAIMMMFSAFSISVFSVSNANDNSDTILQSYDIEPEAYNTEYEEPVGPEEPIAPEEPIGPLDPEESTSEIWDGSIADGFESGTGTEDDPYIIKTAAQLAYLASSTNSGTTYSGKYLKLEADILLNDTTDWETWGTEDGDGNVIAPANTWTAIGTNNNNFRGTFDGNGHTVSGIYINNTADYQGMFGRVYDAAIKNIGVTDSYIKGKRYVGGVVGCSYEGTVTNCYNTGDVSGVSFVGGVVGYSYEEGTVTNCYNTGAVSGTDEVGGVVGCSYEGTVTNCYNIGNVGGTSDVGGIFGAGITVIDCYYLGTCITNPSNTQGTALTEEQMKQKSSYVNWNFNKTWEIGYQDGYDYPTFKCFGSKDYYYTIKFVDGETVLNDFLVHWTETFTVEALTNDTYDFAYYEDENGNRYYVGDVIQYTDDMTYTVAWQVRNTSENCWNGDIDTVWDGAGTEESPYLITSAAELAGLAEQVNNGNCYENQFFKLTSDILLNDDGDIFDYYLTGKNIWTPIGKQIGIASEHGFSGIFDGDGHTVSGIYINNISYKQGLCGSTIGATIKNIGVTDSYIKGKNDVGGIVGYSVDSTITNCYNTGTVSGTSDVGGIVGYSVDSTITNCYNTGTVSGTDGTDGLVGGVIGHSNGDTVTNCYNTGAVSGTYWVGGVVGYNGYGIVTNCYNMGTVSGTDHYVGGVVGRGNTVTDCYNTGIVNGTDHYVGGVVGYVYYKGTVTNCYNMGTVSGTGYVGGVVSYGGEEYSVTNCYNTGIVNGTDHYVGGVVGDDYYKGKVTNCCNMGAVSGTSDVGGVVGSSGDDGTVTNCYNTGSVSGDKRVGGVVGSSGDDTVTNCYNTGSVSGDGYVGGVVGYKYDCTVTNCYYLDTCITNPTNTYGTALTDAQMRVVSNFVGFDFDTVWTMDGNDDYPYPELRGFIKETDMIRGDVDGDGEVTSDDAIRVLYYTLLPDSYTVNQTVDFDGDGFETSDDAIYLLYYTLLPDLYPLD